MDWKVPAATIEQAKSDIVATVGKYVELQKNGAEFVACCPFHKEKTPSFSVNPAKQFYYCFGCGASGDAVDFVSKYENIGFKEAVERIVGKIAPQTGASMFQRPAQKPQEAPEWTPVVPVPGDLKQRPMDTFHRRKGDTWERLTSSNRWEYRDASGGLIGYVCRFELPGGGKDVLPQSFCVNNQTGEMSWRWMSFAKPRPLYRLDVLAQHPAAQALVVEGEKTADAAQALFEAAGVSRDKLVVVSWPGGGKAVRFVDWSPLAGRAVAVWPDADQQPYPDTHEKAGQIVPMLDQPGTVCALDIAERLKGVAKAVKVVTPPTGVPSGWDLADDLPSGFNLLAHIKANAMLADQFVALHTPAEPDPVADLDAAIEHAASDTPPWDDIPAEAYAGGGETVEQEPAADPAPTTAKEKKAAPAASDYSRLEKASGFAILGYDGGEYFLFHHGKGQVMSIRKSDITDIGLVELAEPTFWEMEFPDGKGGINKKSIAHWIFTTAHERGIYDPSKVRGRGAWIDEGRRVFHHGGALTVDGVEMTLSSIKSKFVYQMGHALPAPRDPLTDEEGLRLLRVAEMVRWTMPASAALMAGWAMLAPICGALQWRPHIWLLGAAGSGKSTVQAKFLGALLRGLGIYAQGDSTEPGIRQKLKADARPVLIDEIESNNESDKKRTEAIIGLVRKTSSESWAETLKGTATGDAMNFQIRSMFCLASINANMPTKADIDRLTKLTIKAPDKRNPKASEEHWNKLEAELNQIDGDAELSNRLLARALQLLPVIMENVKTFRRLAAMKFGTQREGDQFGTLLAGCWSLTHSTQATEAEAMDMVEKFDFKEHVEDHDQDDAQRALGEILSSKIRVGPMGDFTVFELIRESVEAHRIGVVDAPLAMATLNRHGIRVELLMNKVCIAPNEKNLLELVKGSSFVTDIKGQILRVKGAEREAKTMKFNGRTQRGISVPLGDILEDDQQEVDDVPF